MDLLLAGESILVLAIVLRSPGQRLKLPGIVSLHILGMLVGPFCISDMAIHSGGKTTPDRILPDKRLLAGEVFITFIPDQTARELAPLLQRKKYRYGASLWKCSHDSPDKTFVPV